MADIRHEAKCIADSNKRLLFAVSLGRDTAMMLHLLLTDLKVDKDRCVFVHYTYYDTMLPYQVKQLCALEKRYGITIIVRPDPFSNLSKIKGWGVAEDRDILLKEHGCDLWVTGMRMDESLQRRGMLNKLKNGIDSKTRECYPLRSWTSRISDAYIRINRIPLAPEYAYGLRDSRNHHGVKAVWLRHEIGEDDFNLAIAQDPQVEIDYVRFKNRLERQGYSEILDDEDPSGTDDGRTIQPS